MIYVKPRKMMSVERMRKQREKHHPIRFMVWYFDRRTVEDLDMDVWSWIKADLMDQFRADVLRWNFSRKATLSPVTISQDYDIDFDRIKLVFEIRRIQQWKILSAMVEELTASAIMTPNEIREAMGWPRR